MFGSIVTIEFFLREHPRTVHIVVIELVFELHWNSFLLLIAPQTRLSCYLMVRLLLKNDSSFEQLIQIFFLAVSLPHYFFPPVVFPLFLLLLDSFYSVLLHTLDGFQKESLQLFHLGISVQVGLDDQTILRVDLNFVDFFGFVL